MNSIISPHDWKPIDGLVLEDAAEEALKANANILVEAGPGAGKTELLAQKACFLFQTNTAKYPQKVLAISFKKDAAANLKKRVNTRSSNIYQTRFSSITCDAFSKRILDHFRNALPTKLRPPANYEIGFKADIEDIIKNLQYKHFIPTDDKKLKFQLDAFLAKQHKEENIWRVFLSGFDGQRTVILTFGMISVLANYILQTNPLILSPLRATYSHVFLDEFQDTTGLQYDLVKTCFLGSKSVLTAVGDNKQRIMGWAGALDNIFDLFQKDFSAEHTHLLMNHRSAPRLVKLQEQMYASLEQESCSIITAPKWDENDGEIRLYISESEEIEAEYIANDIQSKIDEGLSPNEICILCKQKPDKYLHKVIEYLNANDIIARVETNYQDLLKEPIVELIINFLYITFGGKRPKEWEYISSLYSEMGQFDQIEGLNENHITMMEELHLNMSDITKKGKITSSKEDFNKIIIEILAIFGENRIKALYPTYKQGNFYKNTIDKFIELFWQELEFVDKDWKFALENFQGAHSIPIMTIHKSKGLEYTATYFIGLEDGAFWNFSKQPKEDRSAFFVALSRAKNSIAFSYCSKRSKTKYPSQSHNNINEFFELLKSPGMAEIINDNSDLSG